MSQQEPDARLPHLVGEFYAWLWWHSEKTGGAFDLGDTAGRLEVWVDDRLAFRNPHEARASAVMTGHNPAASLEARAALAGGKVLDELRITIKRDDREFGVTLKGPSMDLARVKLPQVVEGGGEEVLYDRMFLYEELVFVLGALFDSFAVERASTRWANEILPALRGWATGEPTDAPVDMTGGGV